MRFSVDSVIHLFNKRGQEGEEGAKKSEQEKEERGGGGGWGREKGRNFPASRGLFSNTREKLSDEEAHFSFSLFFSLLLKPITDHSYYKERRS